MSWQEYVDTSLVGTGHVDKAAIFNTEGTSVWASSPQFNISPKECQEIVAAYADKATPKQVQTSGLHVAGDRFVVLKADDRSIYGKKGKEGIVIVKTTLAMIIAHYPETAQPGSTAVVVEALADYLIKLGY